MPFGEIWKLTFPILQTYVKLEHDLGSELITFNMVAGNIRSTIQMCELKNLKCVVIYTPNVSSTVLLSYEFV